MSECVLQCPEVSVVRLMKWMSSWESLSVKMTTATVWENGGSVSRRRRGGTSWAREVSTEASCTYLTLHHFQNETSSVLLSAFAKLRKVTISCVMLYVPVTVHREQSVKKNTNKMQQFRCLLSTSDVYNLLLSQHVSGIFMPIIRRTKTVYYCIRCLRW